VSGDAAGQYDVMFPVNLFFREQISPWSKRGFTPEASCGQPFEDSALPAPFSKHRWVCTGWELSVARVILPNRS